MIEFLLHKAPWRNSMEVLICDRDHRGDMVAVARAVTLEKLTPEQEGDAFDPTLRLDWEAVQRLMDGLWHAGVRPSSGEGNAGQLGATQKHLEDMRTLVFKTPHGGGKENG